MDKALLLKPRTTEHDHEIPGVGTIRFRTLTREEAHGIVGKKFDKDLIERKILATALIDPALTEDEVSIWYANAPTGEFDPLIKAIMEASGVKPTFAKEAYAQFRDEPGS